MILSNDVNFNSFLELDSRFHFRKTKKHFINNQISSISCFSLIYVVCQSSKVLKAIVFDKNDDLIPIFHFSSFSEDFSRDSRQQIDLDVGFGEADAQMIRF